MPKLAHGVRASSGGVATCSGSTKRTRVTPSPATKNRRNASPSRSMRRTISCCRDCQLLSCEELVEHPLHVGDQLEIRVGAFAHGDAVDVARAHEVADAVLVAVDGELVGRGQTPALQPRFGELLLVEDREPLQGADGAIAAEPVPHQAVVVVVGFAGIDERVP